MMVKDREVWWVGVHGVVNSRTWLSTWTTTEQQIHMIISKIKSNKREPCVKNVINSGLRVYQLCTQTLFQEQWTLYSFENFQFSSVAHSCPALCDPMNCSMPGLPVHHQLPHVNDHALFTWLIMYWSRDWSRTDHVAIMHCSRDWSCNDHVATMYWSRDWSCMIT